MGTPGEILAKLLKKKLAGEETEDLQEELQKSTVEFFSRPGTKATCGNFEASDGGEAKRIKND